MSLLMQMYFSFLVELFPLGFHFENLNNQLNHVRGLAISRCSWVGN